MPSKLPIFAAAVLLPLAVQAAQMPKQGTENVTDVWLVTSSNLVKTGDRMISTFELGGVSRNDAGSGLFDKMGEHCLGTVETSGKAYHLYGTRFYTDADGDSIIGDFDTRTPGHGHALLTGGTGKYAGITGESEWVEYSAAHPIRSLDKMPRGLVTSKVHWKLP